MALNTKSAYAAGYFELQLDGVRVGILNKIGGGNLEAEVIKLPQSDNYYGRRQLGNPKFDDVTIQCGLAMGEPFKDWVKSSLDRKHSYKSGEIVAANFDRKAIHSREFHDALITEVGFPAADAQAKEVAYLNVKFNPERMKFQKGDGKTIQQPSTKTQSVFRCENFRLSIDGLEDSTKLTSKVDALTLKQTTVRDYIGTTRDYELIPGNVEYSNLKITMRESAVDPFADWFHAFVFDGKNTVDHEKHGVLEFMNQSLTEVLLSIELFGLGIFKLTRSDLTRGEERPANVTAEMYCERFNIKEWDD
jgi:hypothetical protein